MDKIKTSFKTLSGKLCDLCKQLTSKGFWDTFLKTKKGIVCVSLAALLVLAAVAGICYGSWRGSQPKFSDVTVELGTQTVTLRDFMTKYAKASKARFVSDPSVIDLNRVGSTELTLGHGNREQIVRLTVQDTVAPKAAILDTYCANIYELPTPDQLVSDVQDADKVTVSFAQQLVVPLDYSDVTVKVILEDGSGNQTQGSCVISFRWVQEAVTLELGEQLTAEMVLRNPERDRVLLDQTQLEQINTAPIGEYTITATVGAITQSCAVLVQDTCGPELVLRQVQRYPGRTAVLDDFVESVTDASEVKEIRLLSEFDVNIKGKYPVTVEAEDIHGNVTTQTTTLWVTNDMVAPVISGASNPMTVEKHSQPDFLAGVSAYDGIDGVCEVVCDSEKLDLHTAGTYYITYSATDTSGNVTTVKRKVTVEHDAEDTTALVKQIASTLSSDVEEIRDYVRYNISYTTNWGGDDPVWYGFTTRTGNCYVHALTLQRLLEEKGYETQLIWVTAKSHYWLIVKLEEGWRHIDATPTPAHSKYSIMTDTTRYATLNGRNWDRSAWPACTEETEGE
jgi:hypothetical protein